MQNQPEPCAVFPPWETVTADVFIASGLLCNLVSFAVTSENPALQILETDVWFPGNLW